MDRVVLDTGPLVAIYNAADDQHETCCLAVRSIAVGSLTTWPVITEVAWLLRQRPSTLRQFLGDLAAGVFDIAAIEPSGTAWISEFLAKYADLPAQLADASVMYAAERHAIDTIFTLDRRDFSVYRFSDGRAPKLLPG